MWVYLPERLIEAYRRRARSKIARPIARSSPRHRGDGVPVDAASLQARVAGIGVMYGIFVSADWPLDANEGARGDVMLVLDIPEELFVEFEWVEDDGIYYRESMIPAAKLNEHIGSLRRLSDDEEEALTNTRWDTLQERFGL